MMIYKTNIETTARQSRSARMQVDRYTYKALRAKFEGKTKSDQVLITNTNEQYK